MKKQRTIVVIGALRVKGNGYITKGNISGLKLSASLLTETANYGDTSHLCDLDLN